MSLPDVQRLVVLRALMLGDTLCAVPALRALRQAWPRAHIALVGLPASRELVSRLDCVDEWIAFPGWPGLPEQPVQTTQLPVFLAAMQARRWDLAVQLHGAGALTNPLLALFGAQHNAGFHAPGAVVPPGDEARFLAWPTRGKETERLLALCRHLGLPAQDAALSFPLHDGDRRALRSLWPAPGPYACVHAGAQLPSRRWPLERFAGVAEALHAHGLAVVLTGSAAEADLVARLAALLDARRVPHVNLAGLTTLWMLGALLQGARLLVCNDTGVSHIAAALRVPSVVVACGSDVSRWAPQDQQRHRVLAAPAPCRPCAVAHCPHGHACALALDLPQVLAAVQAQLATFPNEEIPCPAACAS
jgi:ADP-heptose:LPS heptosyltransferase